MEFSNVFTEEFLEYVKKTGTVPQMVFKEELSKQSKSPEPVEPDVEFDPQNFEITELKYDSEILKVWKTYFSGKMLSKDAKSFLSKGRNEDLVELTKDVTFHESFEDFKFNKKSLNKSVRKFVKERDDEFVKSLEDKEEVVNLVFNPMKIKKAFSLKKMDKRVLNYLTAVLEGKLRFLFENKSSIVENFEKSIVTEKMFVDED